jgi:hypothetical protein
VPNIDAPLSQEALQLWPATAFDTLYNKGFPRGYAYFPNAVVKAKTT